VKPRCGPFQFWQDSRCGLLHHQRQLAAQLQFRVQIAPNRCLRGDLDSPASQQGRRQKRANRFRVRQSAANRFANWQDKDRGRATSWYPAAPLDTERRESPRKRALLWVNLLGPWLLLLRAATAIAAAGRKRDPGSCAGLRAASLLGLRGFFCLQPCPGSSPLMSVTVCCCNTPRGASEASSAGFSFFSRPCR